MLWPGLIAMKCHIRAVTVTNILAYERRVPEFSLVASRSAWRFAIKGSLVSSEIVCKWLSLWNIDYMTLFLKSIPGLVVCYNYTNFYMLICKQNMQQKQIMKLIHSDDIMWINIFDFHTMTYSYGWDTCISPRRTDSTKQIWSVKHNDITSLMCYWYNCLSLK